MKSTYKILSSDLDGKPLAKDVQIKAWSSEYESLFCMDAEPNLFDFPHCRRVLLGSDLLTNNLSVIFRQMDLLDTIEELIVKIDYYSPMVTINKLFFKRIYQAIWKLQQRNPHATYTIAVEDCKLERIKAICRQVQS